MTASSTFLAAVTTVGAGVLGGVFFAFSAFVMPGLRRVPTADGVRAMQGINVSAVTPPLMIALFGTAGLSVWVGLGAARSLSAPRSPWLLAGCATYLIAAVGVTAAGNVPLNNKLAQLHPRAADAAGRWHAYLDDWTLLNHARTVGCIVACGLLVRALLIPER